MIQKNTKIDTKTEYKVNDLHFTHNFFIHKKNIVHQLILTRI